MLRNKLVRSDGSIIDSSVIISCEFTEEVNSTTNLTVGDATASELTVEILNTANILQDESFDYYTIEDGVETKIGVFNVEKPTVATRTTMKFSAYDNIVKTEKNFSGWLRENQSLFPMTLLALVQYACSHSGVTLATTDFPHAGLSVNAFYADNISCRQVLVWAASIAGRFIRADVNGALEFAWYKDARNIVVQPYKSAGSSASLSVTDDGNGNLSINSDDIRVIDDGQGNLELLTNELQVLTGDTGITLAAGMGHAYFQGSLNYENYTTDLIERVQIHHSEDDVGVIYPAEADGNCFTISENMILGMLEPAVVSQVAADLYVQLKDITYVPSSVTIPKSIQIRAGDIISLQDSNGNTFTSYVMKVSIAQGGTSITCTGDKSYGSNAAVASEQYSNLTGKILSISKSVEGLVIENKDLAGKVGSLELTTENFKTFVSDNYVSEDEFGSYKETVSTQFTQTEKNFEMQFTTTKSDIDGVRDELQGVENERKAYIRFEDGDIYLGKSDSEIMLILKNNRISFVQNVVGYPELAYISNNILYITEGEFLTQLRIGKFGFTPGANGNLSFKKVVS
jgi:hypothetical protein